MSGDHLLGLKVWPPSVRWRKNIRSCCPWRSWPPLMSSITRYKALKADLPTPRFTVYPDLGNLTAWGSDVASELTLGARRSQPFI